MHKIIAAALCLSLLCSCGYVTTGTEGLLQAPKLSERQTAIYDALESTLSATNIVYKYPQRGQYRSPFVFYDLDGDNVEEAVAFYAPAGETRSTRVKILDQTGKNVWEPIGDIAVDSDQIDFVSFSNVLSMQASTMIIGWQDTQRKNRKLGIYSLTDNKFETQALESYENYTVHDFDGDGLSEVILLQRRSNRFLVSLLHAASGRLTLSSSITLNSDVESILSLTHGQLWDGTKAIYVDEVFSDEVVATEIIRVSGGGLGLLVGGEQQQDTMETKTPYDQYGLTFRDNETISSDVDGDGQVEIPGSISFPGVTPLDDASVPSTGLTQYMRVTKDGIDVAFTAAVNETAGYMVRFPEKWLGTVTCRVQQETGEWKFYKVDALTQEASLELLRIRVFTGTAERDLFAEGYQSLGTKGTRSYYAYIPKTVNESLAVTHAEVSSMFLLL